MGGVGGESFGTTWAWGRKFWYHVVVLIYTPTTARSTNRRVLVPSPEGTSVVLCGDDSPRIKSDQSIKQSTIQSILLVFFALK